MDDGGLAHKFCEYAAQKLRDHFGQIQRCTALLTRDQVWFRPNASSNSIGNLLLHLRGNVTQWIVSEIGGTTYQRDRQAEFDRREPIDTEALVAGLRDAVERAIGVIRRSDAAVLARRHRIQSYDVTGLSAIFHAVEHFALHAGQIVTITKWLLDVDLSVYDEHGCRRDGRADAVP